ncbi:MAG: beta-galactosidase [Acidobacteria bacterium]|nr:beta-galactosidase [Acidobacteriota bacterium]
MTRAAEPRPLPANSIGWDVELGSGAEIPDPAEASTPPDPNLPPLVVRIGIPWSSVEPERGAYRWEALDALVDAAASRGHEIVLNPYGTNSLYLPSGNGIGPADTEALGAWTACLREIAARYATRVRFFQIGRSPDRPGAGTAVDYAFIFKKSAVAVKSAAPSALIALGTMSSGSVEYAAAVYEEGVAPYADALAASFDGSEKSKEDLKALSGVLLARDPGAKLWLTGVRLLLGNEGFGTLLRAYAEGIGREAALVTFDDPPDGRGRPYHLATMDRARRLFTPGFSPLVESGRGVRVLGPDGQPLAGAATARFFDPTRKLVLMPYDGGEGSHRGGFGVFVLDTADVADPMLFDLASGESSSTVSLQKDPNAGVARVALPFADYPIVLQYRRFTTPEYAAGGENVAVTGERLPTAEEIIAKMQAVQAAQDALQKSLRADARESWHFTFGTQTSVDVDFDEEFFLDPNVGAEWERKVTYVNGVRWKLKTIPELPFVNAEKVTSLPLRITLSKDYSYDYEGREVVDGRPCHVVTFKPVDTTRNLASGRVWVDEQTSARVRIAMVQSNLAAPIISNDQKDSYAPVTGPDGFTYWVLSRIEAQQLISVAGENFVLNKRVTLSRFEINDADFDAVRREALASSNQILRDTDSGLRYTQRDADGTRTVKNVNVHRNLFLLGGAIENQKLKYPIPLAGVNYFDSNLAGKGLQTNLFFAGVVLFANLSDPSFLGSKVDWNVDLEALAISIEDQMFRQDSVSGNVSEREKEAITRKTQSLTGGFGFPFAKFFKVKVEGELAYDTFAQADTKCGAFITPQDTTIQTAYLRPEFHRNAWTVALNSQWSDRQSFAPWGLDRSTDSTCPRPASSATHPDFFEGARNYTRYGGAITKEFYLPKSQKVRVQVEEMGGRDLDRFSKYAFGIFESSLRGYSGSGVRFTDGTIGHLVYNFNLADIIRFEASFDQARVRDRQLGEEFRNYSGVGIGGQFVGPWGTLIQLNVGYALASTVPEFQGQKEYRLEILKLFSQH